MTTQDLGRGAVPNRPVGSGPDDGSLATLFDRSPAQPVHTSAAAEIGFLTGLFGVLAVPFSLMAALCLGLSAVGLVCSIVGLARASRPRVSGGLLASLGLVLCVLTAALVGLRYLGIDTAVGDAAVPTLADWLAALNTLLPTP